MQQVIREYDQRVLNNIIYQMSYDCEIEQKVSLELLEKLRILQNKLNSQNKEDILKLRMYELAISKILVYTLNMSQFIIIKSHTDLGEAHINFGCYEQAFEHLSIAQKKDEKINLAHDKQQLDIKLNQAKIMNLLGKYHLNIQSNSEQILEYLQKANELYKQLQIQQPSQNIVPGEQLADDNFKKVVDILLMDNYYLLCQQYNNTDRLQEAKECVQQIWNFAQKHFGNQSAECGLAMAQSSKIKAKEGNYIQGIEELEKAINLLVDLKYEDSEVISQLYMKLAEYQEQIGESVGYLRTLYKVRTLFSEVYGMEDKRVLKIKRQISMSLLKSEHHQEALNELLQSEEMECNIYGEYSVQVAKTHKIIATILILTQQYNLALKYFNRARKVFQDYNYKKQVMEVDSKIQLLKSIKDKQLGKHLDYNLDPFIKNK